MTPEQLRLRMIGLLVVALVLSVLGNELNARWLGWLAYAAFAGSVVLYLGWRRGVAARRRGRVSVPETKTDETRTRPDE
jgi:hypothetical protein